MLQLDALITFAIGSALATAAGDALKATQYRTQNKYFIFTLLHMNIVVIPLNIYMLWEYTGFETMFYHDATLHGIWPTLSMVACNLSAIAGFMLARKLIRSNKELSAYTLWTSAYTVAITIVACHYDRFLYPGGIREFYQGKTYHVMEFLQSELCIMLTVSLMLVASPVFYAQVFWPGSEGHMTKTRKQSIRRHCIISYLKQGLTAMAVYAVIKLANVVPDGWDWDRLIAIAIGQLAGLILLLPVFLISTRYVVTRRIDIRRTKPQQTLQAMKRQAASRLNERRHSETQLAEYDEQEVDKRNGVDVLPSNGHVLPLKEE